MTISILWIALAVIVGVVLGGLLIAWIIRGAIAAAIGRGLNW